MVPSECEESRSGAGGRVAAVSSEESIVSSARRSVSGEYCGWSELSQLHAKVYPVLNLRFGGCSESTGSDRMYLSVQMRRLYSAPQSKGMSSVDVRSQYDLCDRIA
jgi:hypothetical protein